MRRQLFAGLWAGALVLSLAACQSVQTTQGGVVGVDRKQYVSSLVNRDELTQDAALQYSDVLGKAKQQGALDENPADVERIRRIAKRVIPQVGAFRPDAMEWKWEVHVISSKELNAWCMPGGKIAFYSGLIHGINATDDELAQVMGHEIAHALREHSWEQASSSALSGIGMGAVSIAGAIFGIDPSLIDLAGTAYKVSYELPNSREHETEADRIGIELAARAGYNPTAAQTLWQKMGQASGGEAPPKWLSTHPASEDRQADLKVYGEKVMPLYEQARRGGQAGK